MSKNKNALAASCSRIDNWKTSDQELWAMQIEPSFDIKFKIHFMYHPMWHNHVNIQFSIYIYPASSACHPFVQTHNCNKWKLHNWINAVAFLQPNPNVGVLMVYSVGNSASLVDWGALLWFGFVAETHSPNLYTWGHSISHPCQLSSVIYIWWKYNCRNGVWWMYKGLIPDEVSLGWKQQSFH